MQLSLNSEKRYPTYWTTAANRVYMNTYCASDGNTALKPYVKYSGNLNYIIKSKYIFGIFAETSPNFFTQNMILNRTELLAVYKYLNFSQNYRYGLMAIIPVKWTRIYHLSLQRWLSICIKVERLKMIFLLIRKDLENIKAN